MPLLVFVDRIGHQWTIYHRGTSLGIMKISARLRKYTLQKPVPDINIVRFHSPGHFQLVPGYELGSDKDHADHAWLRSATAQKVQSRADDDLAVAVTNGRRGCRRLRIPRTHVRIIWDALFHWLKCT